MLFLFIYHNKIFLFVLITFIWGAWNWTKWEKVFFDERSVLSGKLDSRHCVTVSWSQEVAPDGGRTIEAATLTLTLLTRYCHFHAEVDRERVRLQQVSVLRNRRLWVVDSLAPGSSSSTRPLSLMSPMETAQKKIVFSPSNFMWADCLSHTVWQQWRNLRATCREQMSREMRFKSPSPPESGGFFIQLTSPQGQTLQSGQIYDLILTCWGGTLIAAAAAALV